MSPLAQGAVADQQRGLHAFAFAQHRFQASPLGVFLRVGLEFLQLGDDGELIEQLVDALAGGGAGFDERSIAAHVVGQHVEAVELLPGAG